MTEKLPGGEWMTCWEKIRWHLIRLLLRKDDAKLLAGGMYTSILDNSLGPNPDLTNHHVKKLHKVQQQRYQLYYVLRWMQKTRVDVCN